MLTGKMKKLFVLIFLAVLLVGTISAMNWDNKLSYSNGENGNSDLKIELKNWFGLGTNYGTAELKSHKSVNEVKKVGAGKQVVIWYDFDFNELYKNGLGNVEFIDMKTGKDVERDWKYVYWETETRTRDVCSEYGKTLNGTTNCLDYSEESYEVETWLPYNSKDIPVGKKRIGIEVEVKWGDYIDGIWVVGGKKIGRHAVWANLDIPFTNYEVFNATGADNFTVPAGVVEVSVLIVAGGGGGADTGGIGGAGGGGAGGVVWNNETAVTPGTNVSVVVGTGGIKGRPPTNGVNSSFGTLIAIGGGRGGTHAPAAPYAGGSGGGRGGENTGDGGAGLQPASASGGYGYNGGGNLGNARAGGGGGGAGSVGSPNSGTTGGAGGTGLEIWGLTWAIGGSGAGESNKDGTGGAPVASSGSGGHAGQVATAENGADGVVIVAWGEIRVNAVILNSPTNAYSSDNRTQNFNYTPTFYIGNIVNCSLWTNETSWSVKASNSSAITNASANIITDSFSSDGTHLWGIGCWNTTNRIFSSSNHSINIDTTPTIIVHSPTNTSYSNPTIYFNATSNLPIDEWRVDYNGTNVTLPFINSSLEVEEGNNFNLNFWGRNADSGVWGLNNSIYFTVNLTEINVTLNSPDNDTLTNTVSNIFNGSATGNSYNLSNATLYIWFSNGTLYSTKTNTSISGTGTEEFTINETLDGLTEYLWNFKVCGETPVKSSCVFSSENRSLTYTPFSINSVSYSKSVLETTKQTFIVNVSANPLVSAVEGKFWYNGTDYTANITNPSSGIYISNDSIDIPLQKTGSSHNKSFLWQFDITLTSGEGTQQNTSINQQEVNRTIFINCNSTYPTQFINFTSRSAENPFSITSATFKSAWEWYIKGGGGSVTRNYTYEDLTEGNNSWAFCTNYNTTFVVTSDIEYDASAYALNSYYLEDAELTNDTNNINLYLLNDSKATATVLEARDSSQDPIENVLIQTQLYDVGTDSFYTVNMGKTSFNGEDLAYLNWYNSLYRFVLILNGEVIKSTNTTRIFETPQIFEILDETTFTFTKFRDFQYSLTYNNASQNFVLTFTKPTGTVDSGCLRVIKREPNNDTLISEACSTSSSATLYSNIGAYGNGTFIATFYATGSRFLGGSLSTTIGASFAEEIHDLLSKNDRLFYSFILLGIVVAMFLVTPVLGILGVLLGTLGGAALGFSLLDYGAFIFISIIGGFAIWFLKRG